MEPPVEESRQTLGDVIRARRKELGLSQWEVAYRMGPSVQQADVSAIERGLIKLPRRERLEQISAALGLPMGELLARSGWANAEEYFARTIEAEPLWGPPADVREVIERIFPELVPLTEAELADVRRYARFLRERRGESDAGSG